MSYLTSFDHQLLRASDADRDRTIYLLGQALATGRLTPDDHAERVSRSLVARTEGELELLIWDLAPPRPTAVAVPPPTPGSWPAPGNWAPSGYWAPPGYWAPTGYLAPAKPASRTNPLAVLSFVLGLVGIVLSPLLFGGFFAVLVGLRARGEIGGSRSEEEGEGLAVAGIVLGVIGVLLGAAIALHHLS
ncbi:MAG TPA: DUF1707 domain-containing protein [Acidimicrobiales bacterium]|nr:DUF1707 domain-containing protein [Acidimicrobiales bacterium]